MTVSPVTAHVRHGNVRHLITSVCVHSSVFCFSEYRHKASSSRNEEGKATYFFVFTDGHKAVERGKVIDHYVRHLLLFVSIISFLLLPFVQWE